MPSWSLERESGNYKGSNLRAKLGKSQKTYMTKGHKLPQRSSQSRDQTRVSSSAGGFFTNWATREAQEYWSG